MTGKIQSLTLALVLTVSLIVLPARAEDPAAPERIEIAKPLVYSLSLMTLALPVIGLVDDYGGPSLDKFTSAFQSRPRWDRDAAFINYALHPLWGSETYLRAREANWGVFGSIGFSMGMSVTWEYLMESWLTHPSTQDLIFTTGIGWVIGELRYQLKQRASEQWNWVLDPIHTTLERQNLIVTRDGNGRTTTLVTLSWNF
jgi:hypothetical protein